MKAIIGGTGFDRLEGLSLKKQFVETPYGGVELFLGQGEDEGLVFLPRHGASHGVPPHRINYRAHALALKQIGVVEAIAIYAVDRSITRLSREKSVSSEISSTSRVEAKSIPSLIDRSLTSKSISRLTKN